MTRSGDQAKTQVKKPAKAVALAYNKNIPAGERSIVDAR
jgi:hypothetical protein